MERIATYLGSVLLGCCMLIMSQAGGASDSFSGDIQARRVVEQYFSALNAGRLATIVSLYHSDSVFLPKNAPCGQRHRRNYSSLSNAL